MNITLRIREKHLEEISDNQKTIEYRESKPFYHKLFADSQAIRSVRFHFQTKRLIECEVERIEHVVLGDATSFYAIHLGLVTYER